MIKDNSAGVSQDINIWCLCRYIALFPPLGYFFMYLVLSYTIFDKKVKGLKKLLPKGNSLYRISRPYFKQHNYLEQAPYGNKTSDSASKDAG